MKQKISITIEEEMIELIENMLADARFRNRSHVIEYSLMEFLKNKDKLGVK
jgi:Arc/MetJ-type ribon-helix-helix transcriptional regulator